MGSYTTSIGSCGVTLLNKVTPLNITLAATEYPVKIHFELKSGGSYWKNSNYIQQTGQFWLHGDAAGETGVNFGSLTLPKVSSNTVLKDFEVSGKSLQGCTLYFDAKGGVGLRNVCSITIETENGKPEEQLDPYLYKRLLPEVTQDSKLVGMARRAKWTVKVEGVDITDEIAKDLISLEVTDEEENEADDLQIKMSDRDGVWLNDWLDPTLRAGSKTKGLSFIVWIGTQDHTGKVSQQRTGEFFLDSMKHNGPPSSVTIKCTSLEIDSLREDKNDKTWENYTVKGIAEEIASKGNLQLLYCSSINPKFDRKEQTEQTDISFLMEVCQDAGLSIKITDGKLVVFDPSLLENEDVIDEITFGDGKYLKWDCSTTSGETTYDYCTVKYTDPATGKCIIGSYKSPAYDEEEERVAEANKDKSDGDEMEEAVHTELRITNKKVKDKDEADTLAEVELNLRNKFERTVSFTIPGNPAVMAGLTLRLKKFGYWSGKYMINEAKHTISKSGYETKIKLRHIGK